MVPDRFSSASRRMVSTGTTTSRTIQKKGEAKKRCSDGHAARAVGQHGGEEPEDVAQHGQEEHGDDIGDGRQEAGRPAPGATG
jgi:hypothetical protein